MSPQLAQKCDHPSYPLSRKSSMSSCHRGGTFTIRSIAAMEQREQACCCRIGHESEA